MYYPVHMPSRHKLGRKRARAIQRAKDIIAERKRRRKKAMRALKAEATEK